MNTAAYNVGQRRRKRVQDNPALKYWWLDYYQQMRVQSLGGPLIENYLEILLRVMNQARSNCTHIFAVRIDLHFPLEGYEGIKNHRLKVMTAFIAQLNWELRRARTKHAPQLRFVWCREKATSANSHYHLLLLLNGHAYRSLGQFKKSADGGYNRENLFHRIMRAWSFAIDWPLEDMQGLVHVAKNRITDKPYRWNFQRDDQAAFEEIFYGASYLCKEFSKTFGQRFHCFDSSTK